MDQAGENAWFTHQYGSHCQREKMLDDVHQFWYSELVLRYSNACMDEATWEETEKNGWTGNPVW